MCRVINVLVLGVFSAPLLRRSKQRYYHMTRRTETKPDLETFTLLNIYRSINLIIFIILKEPSLYWLLLSITAKAQSCI